MEFYKFKDNKISFDPNRYLFQYNTYDNLEYYLKNLTVGASSLYDFNDIFERMFKIRLFQKSDSVEQHLRSVLLQASNGKSDHKRLVTTIEDYLKEFKISCFSKNPLEPLMWSHYADKHHGICLVFDRNQFLDSSIKGGNVNYSNLIPNQAFFQGRTTQAEMGEIVYNIIHTKSLHWRYEQEFRYSKLQKERYFSFNPKSLKGIILGFNNTNEKAITEKISHFEQENDSRVKIFYSYPNKSNFEMEISTEPYKNNSHSSNQGMYFDLPPFEF
tara:strand:- start:265 stop:1080 length:816 start_codon:yes stop_codon:yes gene_type:complete